MFGHPVESGALATRIWEGMMRHRIFEPWDEPMLRKLYLEDHLSTTAIASKFGTVDSVVCRSLKRYGIKSRNHGHQMIWKCPIQKCGVYAGHRRGRVDSARVFAKHMRMVHGIIMTTDQCLRIAKPDQVMMPLQSETLAHQEQEAEPKIYAGSTLE